MIAHAIITVGDTCCRQKNDKSIFAHSIGPHRFSNSFNGRALVCRPLTTLEASAGLFCFMPLQFQDGGGAEFGTLDRVEDVVGLF